MTPLQQAYLAKLKATAEANLEFFKKNSPMIHRLITREQLNASVDISDQGDLYIRYEDGTVKSVTEEVLNVEKKLDKFADLSDRPQMLAFHNLRLVLENPDFGDVQRYHYSNLEPEFGNQIRKHFAKHYPTNDDLSRYPDCGEDHIPVVIVLGTYQAWHISRLLLEYRIRNLIIIDIDVDGFRLSTFLNDYVMLSRLAMEKGTTLSFVIHEDIMGISRAIMNLLMRELPPFFIHGAALYYAMPDLEAIEEIKATVSDTLWEMFFGLGYFDDELISISHTVANLNANLPVYTKPGTVPDDAVAFIIGAGPSLDGLFELIKEYGDRAVVFSCGTALSALAHAGIKPDFHVEQERPSIVFEVLRETNDPNYLKEISFIGLNVVYPEVFKLFKDGAFVWKSADTMSLLLAQHGVDEKVILNTSPTVTNAALSIALSQGFKKVYLMGVDLGYKDDSKHHSQNTVYLKKLPDSGHLNKLLSKGPKKSSTTEGNFGGEVTTTKVFGMARQHMEHSIAHWREAQVFNMNDGALIQGAEPLRREEFICTATPADKSSAITSIKNSFEIRDFNIVLLEESLLGQIDEFIAEVAKIVSSPQKAKNDVVEKITRLYQYIFHEPIRSSPTGLLFRGSVSFLASLTYNALTIIKDEDEALAKAEYDFGVIQDFLDQCRKEIVQIFLEPTSYKKFGSTQ